jgi:alkyl hydroperoxide reductase subunit AhpC
VEGHLLLAEGLHLRLPDRDRRLRQAGHAVRGARRGPLGGSTDNEFSKLGWRRDHKDLSKLGHWSFGDSKGSLVDQLGVRDKNEGVALRATFIVDPDNTIQHVSVNNLNVGRNPEEVLASSMACRPTSSARAIARSAA